MPIEIIPAKKSRKRLLLPYAALLPLIAALVFVRIGRTDAVALYLYSTVTVFGFAAAVLDVRARRIPNGLILAMLGAWAVAVPLQLLVNTPAAAARVVDCVLGFVVGGGIFLLVYVLSRKGLGGGDVKFMAAAGLFLGYGGVVPAMLLGTLLAALAGLTLVLLKKIGRKDAIPLAPFLCAGILAVAFLYY
jgi:prepilin signal peptidase PulO-like enzyme (type II secretory pathway)